MFEDGANKQSKKYPSFSIVNVDIFEAVEKVEKAVSVSCGGSSDAWILTVRLSISTPDLRTGEYVETHEM